MGWFKKISLDFRHSPRTSDSASCTLFPGRPRATKIKIMFRSCPDKVKEKVKDIKYPNLLTSGILCYPHSSRPPPYQLPNNFWSTTVSGGMFLIRNSFPYLVLLVTWSQTKSKMAAKMAAFMCQNCNRLWRSFTLQNLPDRLIFGRLVMQRLVILNHKS